MNLDAVRRGRPGLHRYDLALPCVEVGQRLDQGRLAGSGLNLAKRIQEDLLTFEAEPKEKISALNAVTSILKELTKLREDLQTIEDLRRVEAALLPSLTDTKKFTKL